MPFDRFAVRTTRDLAKQDPEALRKKLKDINDRKAMVNNAPSVTRIKDSEVVLAGALGPLLINELRKLRVGTASGPRSLRAPLA